jgi:hypothetical protein
VPKNLAGARAQNLGISHMPCYCVLIDWTCRAQPLQTQLYIHCSPVKCAAVYTLLTSQKMCHFDVTTSCSPPGLRLRIDLAAPDSDDITINLVLDKKSQLEGIT